MIKLLIFLISFDLFALETKDMQNLYAQGKWELVLLSYESSIKPNISDRDKNLYLSTIYHAPLSFEEKLSHLKNFYHDQGKYKKEKSFVRKLLSLNNHQQLESIKREFKKAQTLNEFNFVQKNLMPIYIISLIRFSECSASEIECQQLYLEALRAYDPNLFVLHALRIMQNEKSLRTIDLANDILYLLKLWEGADDLEAIKDRKNREVIRKLKVWGLVY